MKYDYENIKLTDTPQVLQERHPDLTPEEHKERMLTAVHEASHMIAAMQLPTGGVSVRAYIRVPRIYTKMWGLRGVAGSVHCSADLWEGVIVDFAGIAASYISGDSPLKNVCADDIRHGWETLLNLARTDDKKTIYDVRHELLTQAFKLVAENWGIIDFTATAMLLDARKDGGLEGKRLEGLVALARQAMNTPGFQRGVCFPIPATVPEYINISRSLPSCIAQLGLPYNWGYPYQ